MYFCHNTHEKVPFSKYCMPVNKSSLIKLVSSYIKMKQDNVVRESLLYTEVLKLQEMVSVQPDILTITKHKGGQTMEYSKRCIKSITYNALYTLHTSELLNCTSELDHYNTKF